jgi:cystathionine beta-lyase/cystathionine gamma-synthase
MSLMQRKSLEQCLNFVNSRLLVFSMSPASFLFKINDGLVFRQLSALVGVVLQIDNNFYGQHVQI